MKVEISSLPARKGQEYNMIGSLRFALVASLFTFGCTDGSSQDPNCTEASCNNDSGDDTNDPETFITAARMIAPYGWMGDFSANSDTVCENAAECLFEPDDPDTYELELEGDLFLCVSQETDLTEIDAATTTDLTWEGDALCGLGPDGQYGQYDVETGVYDWNGYDQVWIQIQSWSAPVTKDTFFWEGDGYMLEGTIANDLSSITYHAVTETLDESATITLQ